MFEKPLFVVFNPSAGFGRAKKFARAIRDYFLEKDVKIELVFTKYKRHAIEIVEKADFSKYSGIVAAGGDGTVFEVVNGYFRHKNTGQLPIGIIPIGTGNAFVRDIGLSTNDYSGAIDIICKATPKPSDVAAFSNNGETYYYLNILGLGFITDVTKIAYKLKFLGNLSYTIGVLYQMLFLKSYNLEIEIDGQIIKRKNIFVEISNTRYTSNFLMAPGASFSDGLLDITLLNKLPRLKMLKYFPSIFEGTHIHKEEVETFQSKKISVKTDSSKLLAPDGEIVGQTPFDVSCLYHAISIFQ